MLQASRPRRPATGAATRYASASWTPWHGASTPWKRKGNEQDTAIDADGHHRDPGPAAASLSVPADRPRGRGRARQAGALLQVRQRQRAVLPGAFPGPAGDAG